MTPNPQDSSSGDSPNRYPSGAKPRFSVGILAGGRSARMGVDKAFLLYKGKRFISIMANEVLKVSDDVMVVIGTKEVRNFERRVPRGVKIIRDRYDLSAPLGGVLSALGVAKSSYAALIPCDLPLLKG